MAYCAGRGSELSPHQRLPYGFRGDQSCRVTSVAEPSDAERAWRLRLPCLAVACVQRHRPPRADMVMRPAFARVSVSWCWRLVFPRCLAASSCFRQKGGDVLRGGVAGRQRHRLGPISYARCARTHDHGWWATRERAPRRQGTISALLPKSPLDVHVLLHERQVEAGFATYLACLDLGLHRGVVARHWGNTTVDRTTRSTGGRSKPEGASWGTWEAAAWVVARLGWQRAWLCRAALI